MNKYLSGEKLYGDDFSQEQIQQWYNDELEGYADLGSKDFSNYSYKYHEVNKVHAFNKIRRKQFDNVLGFGSAWGHEFEPIIEKISHLTIVEPSENLRSKTIGSIIPEYVTPTVTGKLDLDNNSFDLITCFSALHHVPNVSFVVKELIRVLKPDGYLLIREPIVSMGDWNRPRKGLTKNERGIPVTFFDALFDNDKSVQVVSKEYFFTLSTFFQRRFGKFFKKPIYAYKSYIMFDKFLSSLLRFNTKYYTKNGLHKIAPSCIFYVIKKMPA